MSIAGLENTNDEQWEQICPEYCKTLVEVFQGLFKARINTLLKEKQLWTKY